MFTPTPQQPPSPAARELGGLIAQVVTDYRAANPDVGSADVRAAFDAARDEVGTGRSCCESRPAALVAAGIAALAVVIAALVKTL